LTFTFVLGRGSGRTMGLGLNAEIDTGKDAAPAATAGAVFGAGLSDVFAANLFTAALASTLAAGFLLLRTRLVAIFAAGFLFLTTGFTAFFGFAFLGFLSIFFLALAFDFLVTIF